MHFPHPSLPTLPCFAMQWEVIDEKHSTVAKAKETLTTLLTLCDNVLKNPQDGHYRKVRAGCRARAHAGQQARD